MLTYEKLGLPLTPGISEQEILSAVRVLGSALHRDRETVYFSMPITTGQRFFSALSNGKEPEMAREKSMSENIESGGALANELHRRIEEGPGRRPVNAIRPCDLFMPEWEQDDYNAFWAEVIAQCVDSLVLLPGWSMSQGCSLEAFVASQLGLLVQDSCLGALSPEQIQGLLQESWDIQVSSGVFVMDDTALRAFRGVGSGYFKDDSMAEMVSLGGNVAQFISFSPDGKLRHAFISGDPDVSNLPILGQISALFARSPDRMVNVRSWDPESPKGDPLAYGLTTAEEALSVVQERLADGKHVIVNETVDILDGGVSGVALGDLVEFAPKSTPKCVEEPGTCCLPRWMASSLFEVVYGVEDFFSVLSTIGGGYRLEFSIHTSPRGYRMNNVLLWERERMEGPTDEPNVVWPNHFSRMIGDKAFGLLLADMVRPMSVPSTLVISRDLHPFPIGYWPRLDNEAWVRTCPRERVPGKFQTVRGYQDVFRIMQEDDPDGTRVASVLVQDGVPAKWSGSLAYIGMSPIIEGTSGTGDAFMQGEAPPEEIPEEIKRDVLDLHQGLEEVLGPVDMEWAHCGRDAHCLQLHRPRLRVSALSTSGPFKEFFAGGGLDALRERIQEAQADGSGIRVLGDIGVTSHVGDLLRDSGLEWEIIPGG